MVTLIVITVLLLDCIFCLWAAKLKGRSSITYLAIGLLGPFGLMALLVLPDHPVAANWDPRERFRRSKLEDTLPQLWILAFASLVLLFILWNSME